MHARQVANAVPEAHLDAWRSILNVHAAVVERTEQALRREGLPPLTWYDVLWALRRAPARRRRMSDLARDLTISRGGLTKLVDRLEAEGLVRRERVSDDGRGSEAVLTRAGAALARRMWPVYAEVLRQTLVPSLSVDDAARVARALRAVTEDRDEASS